MEHRDNGASLHGDNGTSLHETFEMKLTDNFMKGALLFLTASVTGNACIVVTFIKVKQNPVYTRCLFIIHALGDGVTELLLAAIVALLITRNSAIAIMKIHALKIIYALHGTSVHTLCGIALNLYLSICHSRKYRLFVSWKPFVFFIIFCWIFNFCIILPLLYIQDMYHGIIYPNYTKTTFGIWLVVVFCDIGVPIPLVIFCLVKIVRKSSRIEPIRCNASQLHHKLMLSKIITAIAMYYIAGTSAVHLTRMLQIRLKSCKEELQVVLQVMFIFVFSYHVLKFPFYLAVYKPIRQEFLKIFIRNRVAPQVRPVRRQAISMISV